MNNNNNDPKTFTTKQVNDLVLGTFAITALVWTLLGLCVLYPKGLKNGYRVGAIEQCIQTFGCDPDKIRAKYYKEDNVNDATTRD